MDKIKITKLENNKITMPNDNLEYLQKELTNVRDELVDNKYIIEANKVLAAGGLRSAIGCYWNAVVDDLRRKVAHRSLDLFNKEAKQKKEIKTYEDFQNFVTDNDLIDGAYKIGVLSWEAHKLLHQARETRNIFDGHPDSSDPTLFKVFNLVADCNKYVLSQEYPIPVIDTNEYILVMDTANYNKNALAVEQAFSDLPQIYKSELINKFYTLFHKDNTSTTLKGNIEFCLPILWKVLPKEDRQQIGKRVDKDFISGDRKIIDSAINFITIIEGFRYLSNMTRRIIYEPAIKELEDSLDSWYSEGRAVSKLKQLGNILPDELQQRYVTALTFSYVGYSGYYSFDASPKIADIFKTFDNKAVELFIDTILTNEKLQIRIKAAQTLNRLRTLGEIILNEVALKEGNKEFLELLVDKDKTGNFYNRLKK